jgi:hypothetical protein
LTENASPSASQSVWCIEYKWQDFVNENGENICQAVYLLFSADCFEAAVSQPNKGWRFELERNQADMANVSGANQAGEKKHFGQVRLDPEKAYIQCGHGRFGCIVKEEPLHKCSIAQLWSIAIPFRRSVNDKQLLLRG